MMNNNRIQLIALPYILPVTSFPTTSRLNVAVSIDDSSNLSFSLLACFVLWLYANLLMQTINVDGNEINDALSFAFVFFLQVGQ